MSQETTNEAEVPENTLSMSDDAFESLDPVALEEISQEQEALEDPESEPADEESEASADGSEEEGDDEEDIDENSEDEEEEDSESSSEDDEDAEGADSEDEETTDSEEDAEDDESESEEESSEETDDDSDFDFKAEYERLMAPFKANGREMKVKNADEARQLMQMGANYNKKMAAMKPSLKTLKLLEKNDLLGEEKIAHLIDLSKGDKGAIQKLIKDSNVDPLDLDAEAESGYKPSTYNVDDAEMELDEVLDEIQDTPTYQQTVDVVSNKWDNSSRNIIANNPQVLRVLNDQMASGIYETVTTEMERRRALGHLKGLSDIEAYKQVGDELDQQGAFNDTEPEPRQSKQPAQRREKVATKRKKPSTSGKTKQKKRAASSTKAAPASNDNPADFNPLSMSDEEFERHMNEQLL